MKSGYHTYMTSASFFYISRLQNVSWLSANLSHLSLSSTHLHLCFDVISERLQWRRRGRVIIMCRQTTGGAPFCARVAVQGSERAPRLRSAASRSTPSWGACRHDVYTGWGTTKCESNKSSSLLNTAKLCQNSKM